MCSLKPSGPTGFCNTKTLHQSKQVKENEKFNDYIFLVRKEWLMEYYEFINNFFHLYSDILRLNIKINTSQPTVQYANTIGHDQDLIGFCLEISSRYRELSSTESNFYCMDTITIHADIQTCIQMVILKDVKIDRLHYSYYNFNIQLLLIQRYSYGK